MLSIFYKLYIAYFMFLFSFVNILQTSYMLFCIAYNISI